MEQHTLGPLLDSWELALEAENKSPRTIGNYLEALGMFCRWLDEAHPEIEEPEEVTAAICREWIAHLVATRKTTTARTRWAAMRQFWAWAAEEDEVPVNPMEAVKQPAIEDDDSEVAVLTDEQLQALLATCSGPSMIERRDKAIMTLFADTGLRVSALAGAQLPGLDLRERTIKVVEKGRKTVVKPFGVTAARALDRYLRARAKHPYADRSKAIFISTRDGRQMSANTILQMLKRRGAEAGVPEVHPHMFRHTFVDKWLRSGGSEGDLMELVTWSNRDMLGRYAKATRTERAREAHRRLSPMDRLDG